MKRIIGIDPGVRGAYCVLTMDGEIERAEVFPLIEVEKKNTRKGQKTPTRIERYYDRHALAERLLPYQNIEQIGLATLAYVELVHSRPGEGAATSFKFGDCFGQLKMLLSNLNIPTRFVSPKEWCSEMHVTGNRDMKAKERSWLSFERIFTDLARARDKKPPDGIIDAALIAEYGRRRIINGMDEWRME